MTVLETGACSFVINFYYVFRVYFIFVLNAQNETKSPFKYIDLFSKKMGRYFIVIHSRVHSNILIDLFVKNG